MTWDAALKLGRVSNLPTVWTNGLTGMVFAGGSLADARAWPLLLALSLFYVGGMYLNDAFDAEIDARQRPERPIPSGAAPLKTVFIAGAAMLGIGLLLLLWVGFVAAGGTGGWSALGGFTLAIAILVYDWHHQDNPFSPLIMGVCRMLVYITAALAFLVPPTDWLLLVALLLLAYLVGLTYVAKEEHLGDVQSFWPLALMVLPLAYGLFTAFASLVGALAFLLLLLVVLGAVWLLRRRESGDVPLAVSLLLAGICLLDAVFLASAGATGLAWVAIAGFFLTAMLQRLIPGT
jgi:4-hydroxybenzoate polyprenyltransferase